MLTTTFTRMFGLDVPIVLAPMGGSAGGALTAAVSGAGGLGLLGVGGGKDADWIERELAVLAERTSGAPWGAGFQCWSAEPAALDRVLSEGPAAVMLSFGDPGTLAARVHDAGVRLIVQVADVEEARRAVDVGAHVVVAQGTDAGGHGGARGTMGFVPTVVDLVGPTPVLAAGGIADGRGVAAAFALGASGALLGTRFQASPEALVSPAVSKGLLEGLGDDTVRSRVPDIARGVPWPERYTGRAVRTAFVDRWRDHEDALRADAGAREAYLAAAADGDPEATVVWASDALDLITDLVPAAEILTALAAEAEESIRSLTQSYV